MQQLSESQIKHVDTDEPVILFFFSPFCGTCKVAERMVNIVEQMLPQMKFMKGNTNLMPDLCREWKISTVPCVLVLHRQQVTEQLNAVHSVEHIYHVVKDYANLQK